MPYVPAVFNDTRTAVVQSWPRRSFRGGRGRDLDQFLEFVKIENHHLNLYPGYPMGYSS